MIAQLTNIFIDVITPVFALVIIGYLAAPNLGLESRTITRYAYYLLVPALTFNIIASAQVKASDALKMIIFAIVIQLLLAGLGWGAAKALKRSTKMASAYIMIAVFGNTGNFGLPLIEFRLGKEALAAATVYMLAITTFGFIISVAAANLSKGGGIKAALAVFKTPALLAVIPALIINANDIQIPLFLDRIINLLSSATIPTMLVALGVQLSALKNVKFSSDVIAASAIRLLVGAPLAILLAIPFGLSGFARDAGILQTAMPAAVLTSIIAMEHDLLPDFVTTTVLFSTLASVITLTLVMILI